MWARLAVLALPAALGLTWAPVARAADKATCLRAYESAQTDRNARKLRASRSKLLVCVEPECPELLRKDCSAWLSEVERAIPTVVIVARSGGKELTKVRVLVDDEPLAESLTGASLEVDPGRRIFRVEAHGYVPVERTISIQEGDKDRELEVELELTSKPAKDEQPASIPTATWVLAGVGAVGLLGFTYFGLKGLDGRGELKQCKGECAEEDVDAVRADFTRADVSLAVSALAFGGAAYFYFSSRGDPKKTPATERSSVSLGIAPRRGGAGAALQLAF